MKDDVEWEKVWREADDEFLTESAKDHLWQALQSPQPGFGRFSQICREAHRRGKPELLLRALERREIHVDRDVAVRVAVHLNAGAVHALDPVINLVLGGDDVASVKRLYAGIGRAQRHGALRE